MSTVAALLSSHDAGDVWNLDPARSTFAFRNKTMWGLMTVKGHFGEVRGDARVTYTGAVSGRLAHHCRVAEHPKQETRRASAFGRFLQLQLMG